MPIEIEGVVDDTEQGQLQQTHLGLSGRLGAHVERRAANSKRGGGRKGHSGGDKEGGDGELHV